MAERALGIPSTDVAAAAARVTAPTLIVSGEVGLDHVVAGGALEYTDLVSNARAVVLERTGHLGSITRPDVFAGVVGQFLADVADAELGVRARLKPDDPEAA
jgi:pimeloyl-ACP methyl ester carboxylesterase